ncbi:MAG: hypothetical protein QXV32_02080 [Conexivisphaerales archaeon]
MPYNVVKVGPSSESEYAIKELVNLGLALRIGGTAMVLTQPPEELRGWVEVSLKRSVILVKAGDEKRTHEVFESFIEKTSGYFWAQDQFFNERSFDLLQAIPPNVAIRVPRGIKVDPNDDAQAIFNRAVRLDAIRGPKFTIRFVGGKSSGTAPFHGR